MLLYTDYTIIVVGLYTDYTVVAVGLYTDYTVVVVGLYTDYAERRKHSTGGGSLSPPQIPSPPPPIDISTLGTVSCNQMGTVFEEMFAWAAQLIYRNKESI